MSLLFAGVFRNRRNIEAKSISSRSGACRVGTNAPNGLVKAKWHGASSNL